MVASRDRHFNRKISAETNVLPTGIARAKGLNECSSCVTATVIDYDEFEIVRQIPRTSSYFLLQPSNIVSLVTCGNHKRNEVALATFGLRRMCDFWFH